ncbi:hypothetical protein BJ912DRAFT_986680 [Pholiota molesta]|nr:hypothetical protein BJ912DRAFT_986680 [Pholiota molesta]
MASTVVDANCRVPTELIRPIFEQIRDRETLVSLCLSSKFLEPEAQRILYSSPLGHRSHPGQHIRFLTSLLLSPPLALLVKNYSVILVLGSQKVAFWKLVQSVLPMMVNLKVFSISAASKDLKLLPMDTLVFQLEVLSWVQIDGGNSEMFTRWLGTQKALKELKWISRGPVDISPGTCPKLIRLEGNFHVIAALLPNRPIKQLYWTSDVTLKGLAAFFEELAYDFGRLDSLSFEKHSHAVDYRSLVGHLPSLTSLELLGDGKEFSNDIPLPPNLQVLILSIWKGYGKNTTFPMAQRPDVIEKTFSRTPTLSRVDVAAQLVGIEIFYERWEHGNRREGFVSSKDVLQGHKILLYEY